MDDLKVVPTPTTEESLGAASAITVESVHESLRKSMAGVVGKPLGETTLASVRGVSHRSLQGLVETGLVQDFDIGTVQTKHRSKNFLGRCLDFVRWKTPWRRWHYKPFYVQVSLVEKLQVLWEHTGVFEDMADKDFNALLESVQGVTVWEERYPENPYNIVMTDITVRPVVPVDFVSFTVTLGENDVRDADQD